MNANIVNADWLKKHQNDADLIILDASPKGNVSGLKPEHPGVQIKGARPVSLKEDLSQKEAPFPNTLPTEEAFQSTAQRLGIGRTSFVVVYDNLGIYTSPRVWWLFKSMGLEECFVLNGGLDEWINIGGETEPIKAYDGSAGNFAAQLNTEAWRNISAVEANIESKKEVVIDARSEGRFLGTAPEPREGLSSGSIPNSKNLPFKRVLENGKLKGEEALKEMFDGLAGENQPLVLSCGSGLTACINLLAASQVLENPLSVYDGSWTEWAQLKPNLIER